MTIRARTARSVCNQAEYKLFEDSRRPNLGQLTQKQLQQHMIRSQKACRKAHEKAQKAKEKADSSANARREYEKAARLVEVMEDVMRRYESNFERFMTDMAGTATGAQKRHTGSRGRSKVSPSTSSLRAKKMAKQSRVNEGAAPRIEGHLSSRDRRQQSYNDRRR